MSARKRHIFFLPFIRILAPPPLVFQHSLDTLAQFGCFAGIASGVGPAHLPQFAYGILTVVLSGLGAARAAGFSHARYVGIGVRVSPPEVREPGNPVGRWLAHYPDQREKKD